MTRLFDSVEKAAFRMPQAPSFTCGDRSYTWAQTRDRIYGVAQALLDLGVACGERVAFLGLNGIELVESFYAPNLIGAVFVPFNFRLSKAELDELMADCQPAVLVADAEYADLARDLLKRRGGACRLVVAETAARVDELSYEVLARTPYDKAKIDSLSSHDEALATIFYTGGTTGTPKGVMLSHLNQTVNALGGLSGYGVSPEDVHLLSGPMFHVAAASRIFLAALLGNHTIIMKRFEVDDMVRLIGEHRATIAQMVPTMLLSFLDRVDRDKPDLSSLRMMTYGASPLPPSLLERALETFPDLLFCQVFGMTEAAPALTMLEPHHHQLSGEFVDKLSSVGLPLPHVDLRVVDEEGATCPPDIPGEIIARGPNIMMGYYRKPEETAAVLRNGWYHTGDAGAVDVDGFLTITGRIKDMIVSGGENIYPIEVENVLARHPAVEAAAVIGVPHDYWVESVHAVIVPIAGKAPGAQEIIAYVRDQIAHYKCPRSVSFVETLPMTGVNKVDKRALRAPFWKDHS